MDNHKIMMLTPREYQPTVRIANYIHAPPHGAWGERRIPDWELIFVVSGMLTYSDAEGAELDVAHGQVLTIAPGLLHSLRVASQSDGATLSCIHGELLPEGTALARNYLPARTPARVTSDFDPVLMHDLFRRCSDAFEGHSVLRQEICRTIAREIWLRLAECWSRTDNVQLSQRVAAMVQYLRDHLFETVGRRELAARFHLSPEHVNYLFKQELGISPTQLVQRERILIAYRMIQEEGLSVKEAADRVGYRDPFYFSRLFSRIAGISPGRV